MLYLLQGIALKLSRTEVLTSTELQGLLAERCAQHIAKVSIKVMDDFVQSRTSKVTQQNGLGIGCRLQAIDDICQRMMAIVLKASCQ